MILQSQRATTAVFVNQTNFIVLLIIAFKLKKRENSFF